jgi:hypothetical protein
MPVVQSKADTDSEASNCLSSCAWNLRFNCNLFSFCCNSLWAWVQPEPDTTLASLSVSSKRLEPALSDTELDLFFSQVFSLFWEFHVLFPDLSYTLTKQHILYASFHDLLFAVLSMWTLLLCCLITPSGCKFYAGAQNKFSRPAWKAATHSYMIRLLKSPSCYFWFSLCAAQIWIITPADARTNMASKLVSENETM